MLLYLPSDPDVAVTGMLVVSFLKVSDTVAPETAGLMAPDAVSDSPVLIVGLSTVQLIALGVLLTKGFASPRTVPEILPDCAAGKGCSWKFTPEVTIPTVTEMPVFWLSM